jgi:hypothetical protein
MFTPPLFMLVDTVQVHYLFTNARRVAGVAVIFKAVSAKPGDDALSVTSPASPVD